MLVKQKKIVVEQLNSIHMTGQASLPDGKIIKVHGTYAFGGSISIYDDTNRRWLYDNEWEWEWEWTKR